MVQYICPKCNKVFAKKYNYNCHLARKIPCNTKKTCIHCKKTFCNKSYLKKHLSKCKMSTINIKSHKDDNDCSGRVICKLCSKTFANNQCLEKHQDSSCKGKQLQGISKNHIILMLLKLNPNIDVDEEFIFNDDNYIDNDDNDNIGTGISNKNVEEVLSRNTSNNTMSNVYNNNSTTINNISVDNSINTTINVVHINAFGQETLDHIPKKEWGRILSKGFNSVIELIEKTHFDENCPSNHNIYIPNYRENYVKIYDGKQWNVNVSNQVIDDLYERATDKVFEKYKEYEKIIYEHVKKKIRNLDAYDKENDPTFYDKTVKDIKLLLHNKKNIPIETISSINL